MAQLFHMAFGSRPAGTRCVAGIHGRWLVRRAAQCLTLGLWFLVAQPGHAFGPRGHELVAQLATWFLNDDAIQLLERHYGTNFRSAFIADANYPRVLLNQPGNEWRIGFHYTWFDTTDNGFVMADNCPRGVCSVGAVLAARDMLMNPDETPERQRDALRFLVHYVADLHDPVNAGYPQDKGGRGLVLTDSNLARHTLFSLWQEALFDELAYPPFVMANLWARQLSDTDRQAWQTGEPQSWVWETHELARDLAWPLVDEAGGWNAIYRRDALPALEIQLMKAGVRLAWMLNQTAALERFPAPPVGSGNLMDFADN